MPGPPDHDDWADCPDCGGVLGGSWHQRTCLKPKRTSVYDHPHSRANRSMQHNDPVVRPKRKGRKPPQPQLQPQPKTRTRGVPVTSPIIPPSYKPPKMRKLRKPPPGGWSRRSVWTISGGGFETNRRRH